MNSSVLNSSLFCNVNKHFNNCKENDNCEQGYIKSVERSISHCITFCYMDIALVQQKKIKVKDNYE